MALCTLVINDEVNCQFLNLDVETRRILVKKFKYEDPKAKYLPSVKLGRWDGSVNFFSIGGSTYLSMLGPILEILEQRGYHVDVVDKRTSPALEFNKIGNDFWGDQCWPAGHRFENTPIRLRDDQVEAVNVFLENPQALQALATGFGKCLSGKTELKLYKGSSGKTYQMPLYGLATLIENHNFIRLKNNQEVNIESEDLYIDTPTGRAKLKYFIMKVGLPAVEITLSNGYTFTGAEKHIVLQNSNEIFLKHLYPGETIDHRDGPMTVESITFVDPIVCFDIGIDAPHVYYDANGVLHHNTILTATLCKICEKYGRTITIVPNKSLVEQTEEDFVNCGLDVGVYYGGRKDLNKLHTICTWQSLNVLDKKNVKTDDDKEQAINLSSFLTNVNTVIVDECFAGNTLIETPFEPKPISEIKVGDKVVNYNEESKKYSVDTVVKVFVNMEKSKSTDMLRLTLSNKTTIECTSNHKLLTDCGWVRADNITEDMELITGYYVTDKITVVDKVVISRPEKVYNLHIENNHNYIANGVVVANCHTAKAKVLQTLLTNHCANAPIRWGITGTIPKLEVEYQMIRASIGDVVNQVKAHELQEQGVLSNCHVNVIQTAEWVEFKKYPDEINYLVTNASRVEFLASKIAAIATSGNTLVLVDRIETGNMLKEILSANGEDIPFVSGSVKSKARKEEYDDIKIANNKILIATYGVAAVGINIPRIFNMVMIEPGKSFVRVIQSIGRGLRKANDKDHVEIYDMCASTKYSKRHLTERKQYYKEANYKFTVNKVARDIK